MITVLDIQNHITKLLKQSFPDYQIRVEDNKQDVSTPAFHVSVRPLLTVGRMKNKNKLVNVNIYYLSKNKTHRENLIMSEQLDDMFHLTLKVYDRELYIQDLTISEVDTTLNVGFTLDYHIGVEYEIENDLMEDLEINRRRWLHGITSN